MNQDCSTPILEILHKIVLLQNKEIINDNASCDRPFLGPLNILNYNTRPIMLYNRYTAEPWSFNYTTDATTNATNIFRIESIDQCSATIRLLSFDEETGQYTNINQFVTIDLTTIGAIRCLADTYINI